MPADPSLQRIQTVCLMVLTAVALGAALHWLAPVMVPFVLAFFLTVVLTPVVDLLRRRLKLAVPLALLGTLGIGVVILVLLGGLVSRSVAQIQDNSDTYVENINSMWGRFQTSQLAEWLQLDEEENPGADADLSPVPAPEPGPGAEGAEGAQAEGGDWLLRAEAVQGVIGTAVNALINVLSMGFLVLIFMLFLVTGQAHGGMLGDVERRIKGYVTTKTYVSAITGVLVGLCLSVLGVEMAVVFGLFAFLMNFIPSVGSIFSTLLPLPIVLMGDYSTTTAVLAIALPGAIQFTIGNVLEPKMLGDSMDLHPVTILLALIFWGMIWGPVGALLATPLTAVLRVLLERVELTRPVAEAMAGRLGAATSATAR